MLQQLLASATIALAPLSVFAQTPLSGEATKALISGNTLYVSMPEGAPGASKGGIARIYYAENGQSVAQLPDGPKLSGTWVLVEEGYCIDWEKGPKNSCSSLARGAGQFILTDPESGEVRGAVNRIATGNPENL